MEVLGTYSKVKRPTETILNLLREAQEAQAARPGVARKTTRMPRLKADQVAELARRYEAGKTTYDLAEESGYNRHTIAAALRKSGLKLRK